MRSNLNMSVKVKGSSATLPLPFNHNVGDVFDGIITNSIRKKRSERSYEALGSSPIHPSIASSHTKRRKKKNNGSNLKHEF